jgi:hypothetical protein
VHKGCERDGQESRHTSHSRTVHTPPLTLRTSCPCCPAVAALRASPSYPLTSALCVQSPSATSPFTSRVSHATPILHQRRRHAVGAHPVPEEWSAWSVYPGDLVIHCLSRYTLVPTVNTTPPTASCGVSTNVVFISQQSHGCDQQLAAVHPTVITWTGISLQVLLIERLKVYKERREGSTCERVASGYRWQRHTFKASA